MNEPLLAQAKNTDMYCTEVKTEVSIDRLTSAANPRNFERVPAGAKFRLSMVLDIYNVDLENSEEGRADKFAELISQGLRLIEDDYLGGQGTRGYGEVEFHIKTITEKTADHYRDPESRPQESDFERYFGQFMNREQC